MLTVLPQLEGGCINYWEAGNWALHPDADPVGPKTAREHRQLHLHLLGRSRSAASSDLRWGEAPRFPAFVDRFSWAAAHRRLTQAECDSIVQSAVAILRDKYGMSVPSPC